MATHLQSKFTFNPGVEVTEDTKNLPAVINLSGSATVSTGKGGSTPANASRVNGTVGASSDADGIVTPVRLEATDFYQIVILGLLRLNRNYTRKLQTSWLIDVRTVV